MSQDKCSKQEIISKIINSGALEIRNVDNGQDPFVYSTGNRGPGYIMIKGLVGQPSIMRFLCRQLAFKVIDEAEFDFIEGNATGGMIPAWELNNQVCDILKKEIPYCYLRVSRKEGGHDELITGDRNNPLIKKGMKALVVEELVNYAGTTGNAAVAFRKEGYLVSHGACILSYHHKESLNRLKEKEVTLVPLITLPELLEISAAENLLDQSTVTSYQEFLVDPIKWQLSRNLVIPEESALKAIKQGTKMIKLDTKEALDLGAPAAKVNHDMIYYKKA